jgi:hypothetical protein
MLTVVARKRNVLHRKIGIMAVVVSVDAAPTTLIGEIVLDYACEDTGLAASALRLIESEPN